MSVFDKLRRDAGRPVTDPSDHRLFSGTIDDQRQARREYARHSRIRRIVRSRAQSSRPSATACSSTKRPATGTARSAATPTSARPTTSARTP